MYNGNSRAYHHSSSTKKDGQTLLERDLAIFGKCKKALKYIPTGQRQKLKEELDFIDYVLFAKEVEQYERGRFNRLYPDVLDTCTIRIYDYNL